MQPNFEIQENNKQCLVSKLPFRTTPKGQDSGEVGPSTQSLEFAVKRECQALQTAASAPLLPKIRPESPTLAMLRAQSRH